MWEPERPVSAPAERPDGCRPCGGLGAPDPISGKPAKWARAERESERSIVPARPWQQKHGGGKGPYLVYVPSGGKGW